MASQSTVTVPSKRKAVSTRVPRPRKKQAVTKTFKRSTIQKIERNALNSPLLSLPGEIREKILKLVVGDKVIHNYGDHKEPNRLQLELALSNLQVLLLLPLEYATVELDIRSFPIFPRKTIEPKIKLLAAEFQRMLLDPAGPEKVKEVGITMKGTRLHSQLPGNIFSS